MADPRLPIESLPFQGIAELRRPGGHASQSGNVAEGRLGQRGWPVRGGARPLVSRVTGSEEGGPKGAVSRSGQSVRA